MDTHFWLHKWEQNDIAFHEHEANPLLVKHVKSLSLAKGSRIFLPLCGKTLDIAWLLSQGYAIVGAELSEKAIEKLFVDLGVKPNISGAGDVKHYSDKNIDIFVGNIFDLSRTQLGPVDAVYDRAALVALPEEMRNRYTAHLTSLTNTSPQLLLCFEYDQCVMPGPPFSISSEEVNKHYSDIYDVKILESISVRGGLKGKHTATENVWLLQND